MYVYKSIFQGIFNVDIPGEFKGQVVPSQEIKVSKKLTGRLLESFVLVNDNKTKTTVTTQDKIIETVAKEEVAKEEVAKEEVAKEEVAKEEVAKEEVAKEEVAKEEVAKEEVAKEEETPKRRTTRKRK